MIYAEITYTGEVDQDNERKFYLQFHGKDEATNEQSMWNNYITTEFNVKNHIATTLSATDNPHFSWDHLISRGLILNYLANRKFTPASENLFFKKSFSFFD